MKFYNQAAQKMIAKIIKAESHSFLKHLSIRNRLILIFLLVSILPLALMGLISYHISKAAITDKIAKYSLRELTQITNNLNLELKRYEDFSYQTISNQEINQTLTECATNSEMSFIDINQRLKRIFDDQVMAWESNSIGILFCSIKNDIHYTAGTGNVSAEDFRETPDFQKAIAKKGQIHWFYQEGCLGFSRLVGNLANLQPVGVVAVSLDLSKIDQAIHYTLYNESSDHSEKAILKHPYSMIINGEGIILASPFQEDWGKNIDTLVRDRNFLEKLTDLGEEAGKFPERVRNKDVLLTVNPISDKEWYLLGVAPNSYLYAESATVGLWAFGLGIVISVIVVIISIMVALGISKPLQQVMQAMKRAENGDLAANVSLKSRDELGQLGQSFNRMIMQIRVLLKDTKDVVAEVLKHSKILEESSAQSTHTAKAVVTATMEITRGTIEQTQEAEKTTQKMADLSKRIETVVAKSSEVGEITGSVRKMGLQSQEVIGRLRQKANETDAITNEVVKDIHELSSSAEEIRSLTEIITGISEQTNLLALNAAIEAARAGEYGLGFAVVAEEINKLAAQSQEAAKTINNILKKIQAKSAVSTQTVSRAHQIVEEQLVAVEQAQKSFDGINEAMNNVVSRMSEVNENIKKMNTVKEETINSIMNISAISEETAAASQEVSASTEEQTAIAEQVSALAGELLKIADLLVNSMAKFKMNIS